MHKGLLRSTPFRLVLILGFAFVVTLGLSAVVSFRLIHEDLMERVDRDLVDTANVLEQSFDASDLPDLLDLIDSHVRATVGKRQVFLLTDQAGRVLAGNLTRPIDGEGYRTLGTTELGMAKEDGRYRILLRPVSSYRLLVGLSLTESDEIGYLVLTVLAWTSAVFAAVILLLGLIFAVRGQRRLEVIAGTLDSVSQGAMAARIPITGRNDDIDLLVGRVNSALDRLAALVEGMRQVSADIAHELKTPLNSLSIILESATEHTSGDAELARLLGEAQEEIARVTTIFDALLRIAQIESGARRARFASIELRPILERLAEAYGPVASDNGQVLRFEADEMGIVQGDADLLAQAIANLIENAIRHCPNGASVLLRGSRQRDGVVMTVADNGPGIPDDDKPHVFDRLYRVEKSRTTPGNGLGLALVKAVADLHGATVELADNEPGTVVSIRIPFAPRADK